MFRENGVRCSGLIDYENRLTLSRYVWVQVSAELDGDRILVTEVNSKKAASAFYPPDHLYKIYGVCKHRSSLKWERQGPPPPSFVSDAQTRLA